jgi:putative membrane protein
MTDANILALMHEANTGEIQAAQLAEQKAQSTEVKAFARDMVRDHKQLDATGTRIAQQTGVSPQPPAGDTLTQHAQHEAAELQSLSGAAFDRAYMHDQVADHETVLNLLKEAQPQAQHDQVKTAVRTAITKVQEHLDKAQRIDGQLRGTA